MTNTADNFPEAMVSAAASALHDDWRAPRFDPATGIYDPRPKRTKDASWVAAHGTDTVDIANTRYAELPSDWQGENKRAALVALGLVARADAAGLDIDASEFEEAASAEVHDGWLEVNGEWAEPQQQLPYPELPEDEKEKDRFVIRSARAAYRAHRA